MKLILLTAGAFLSFNGAFMLTFSNFNLGVILTAAAGIFFLLWGIFYEKIKQASKAGIIKYIRLLVIVLISLEALLTAFIAAFGLSDNSPYNEDALIVLGAGIHGEKVGKEDLNPNRLLEDIFGSFCLVVLDLRQQTFVLRIKIAQKYLAKRCIAV